MPAVLKFKLQAKKFPLLNQWMTAKFVAAISNCYAYNNQKIAKHISNRWLAVKSFKG